MTIIEIQTSAQTVLVLKVQILFNVSVLVGSRLILLIGQWIRRGWLCV
jgi:hypothetical protein